MNKAQDISASYIIGKPRQVSLFRNGANQAIRIPKEFELPGKEALLYRDGNKLVLEAIITEPERGSAKYERETDWRDMCTWWKAFTF